MTTGANIIDRPVSKFEKNFTFPNSSTYPGCLVWGNDSQGPFLTFLIREGISASQYRFRSDGSVYVLSPGLDHVNANWKTGLVIGDDASDSPVVFKPEHVEFIKTELIRRRYRIENAPVDRLAHRHREVDVAVHDALLSLVDEKVGTYVLNTTLPLTEDCFLAGSVTFGVEYSGGAFIKINVGSEDQPFAYKLTQDSRLSVEIGDGCKISLLIDAVRRLNISPVEEKFIFETLEKMSPLIKADILEKVEASDFSPSNAEELFALLDSTFELRASQLNQTDAGISLA